MEDDSILGGPKWIVSELIPHPGFTVVYGAPKSGKTTLLAYLCAAIVSRKPFLGRDVESGPILWLDLEQHIQLTAETLVYAGAGMQSHRIHLFNGPSPGKRLILEEVKQLQPVVVVVDSLSRLLQLHSEDDASQMNKGLELLLRIRAMGTSVIAIHHDRKREGASGRNMRGSSALHAATDLTVEVRKGGKDEARQLEMTTRYRGVPDKLGITLLDGGYQVSDGPKYQGDDELVSQLAHGPLNAHQWGEKAGMTRQRIGQRVVALVSSGRVVKTGSGGKHDPFLYSLPVSPESATPI